MRLKATFENGPCLAVNALVLGKKMKSIELLLVLVLVLALPFVSAGADDHALTAPVAETTARREGTADPRRKSVFEGEDEVTWGFAGEAPYVDIFNDTFMQRRIAGQINATMYGDETNPEFKKRLYQGTALRVSLDGLTFRKMKDRPDLFEVIIVGPIRTVKLVKKFSVADLESGKSFLDVPMPKVGRNLAGLGQASGGGTLSFHFDRAKGQVMVDEFKGDFTLALGLTQKDSGSMSDLKLVPKELSDRPEMEAKFLLKE